MTYRPLARASLALLAVAVMTAGCGGGGAPGPKAPGGIRTRAVRDGRPPLAVVARTGDAMSALAVAVTTEGIAPERGAVPSVALAALVEARLANRSAGGEDGGVTTVGGWAGWRLRALVQSASSAASLVEAIRQAMLAPVTADDPALAAVARKIEALARRPLPDRALADVAQCTGEAFGFGADIPPTATELETWRQAAHGTSRVAFSVAGDEALASSVADALGEGPAWPAATPVGIVHHASPDSPAATYDASSEIPDGAARVIVVARTASPDQAVGPASVLGDPRGPLASRLAALDAPARVRSVVATAHGDGGCLAVTLDLAARDLERDAAARIATAAALARQEITVELADVAPASDAGGELAQRAPDPRDAAERAAWWSLSGRSPEPGDGPRLSLTIGLAATRDTGASASLPVAEIRTELDRATIAWHAPVVEAKSRVERGQGETWILVASPCGTTGEAADAGSSAAVATAAALQAEASAADARVEPFVSPDGIGVLAHGPARRGESAQAHARRLADIAARAFAADALDGARTSQARTALLAHASETEARLLAYAGNALAPGHPSWLAPLGTRTGLSSIADDDIEARAAALRGGPLRVAVLASDDQAQADAAVRSVDRWVARRPGEVRACPMPPDVKARPGTYAVDLPAGARSEVVLAAPLASTDPAARTAATWLAAALDGPDGLLARALGGPSGDGAHALASTWSVAVLGAPRTPALVLRLVSDDASLDAAVAQTRALLDRLRQGALRDEDVTRATRVVARAQLSAALDPRLRTIALWRKEATPQAPTLDALRTFAAATLRDDALVIVAARPPHLPVRPAAGHDGRTKGR